MYQNLKHDMKTYSKHSNYKPLKTTYNIIYFYKYTKSKRHKNINTLINPSLKLKELNNLLSVGKTIFKKLISI